MKSLINLFVILLLISCNSKEQSVDNETKQLSNFLEEIGYELPFKHNAYYFLPINNCSSCDDDYKKFINKTYNKEAVQLIICSTNPQKTRLMIGEELRKYLIIDKKHLATMKYNLLNNSITVYQVSDNKVNHKYQVKTGELTNQLIQE